MTFFERAFKSHKEDQPASERYRAGGKIRQERGLHWRSKTDISLQTKQVLSQVQMQSLNILSMSMTELEEFLQNEEIENPLVEYSSGRQEGEPAGGLPGVRPVL